MQILISNKEGIIRTKMGFLTTIMEFEKKKVKEKFEAM